MRPARLVTWVMALVIAGAVTGCGTGGSQGGAALKLVSRSTAMLPPSAQTIMTSSGQLIASIVIQLAPDGSGWLQDDVALYRVTDGGTTWTKVRTAPQGFFRLFSPGVLRIGDLLTTDAGRTWHPVAPMPAGTLSDSELSARLWYAYVRVSRPLFSHGVLYRTTDAGAHWVRVAADLPTSSGYPVISFADTNHGVLVLQAVRSNVPIGVPRVYVTRDAGAAWTRVSLPGVRDNETTTLVDLYPGGAGTLDIVLPAHGVQYSTLTVYRSTDYGATWTRGQSVSVSCGVCEQVVSGDVQMTDQYNAPNYVTDDAGRTWQSLPGRLDGLLAQGPVYFLGPSEAIAYAITSENPPDVTISVSNDGGYAWSPPRVVTVQ